MSERLIGKIISTIRVEVTSITCREFEQICEVIHDVFEKHAPTHDEPIPLVSVEQPAEDPRYASLEVHTLPLDAAKLEFLRVDGFWFVKASEGVQEAIENAWRNGVAANY